MGALRALRRLSAFSSKRALVITADKGNGNVDSFRGLVDPALGLHGSFSMMVNYHAVSLWVASQNGLSLVDRHEHSDLLVNVFLLGDDSQLADETPDKDCTNEDCRLHRLTKMNAKIEERKTTFSKAYPHLWEAYSDRILSFGPSDYDKLFTFHREHSSEHQDLITVMAVLRLTYWDADMFAIYSHFIVDQLSTANAFLKADVAEGMEKVWKTFFLTEQNTDIVSEIGRIFVQTQRIHEAEAFYRRFLSYRPKSAIGMVNLGICLHHQGDTEAATQQFNDALLADPDYELAKDWLAAVNRPTGGFDDDHEENEELDRSAFQNEL